MPSATLTLQQQTLIAELCSALGFADYEILQLTALEQAQLDSLFNSPLFHSEVRALQQRFTAAQSHDLSIALRAQGQDSLETIINIRDTLTIHPSIRLRAAESILDRIEETSKQHKVSHSMTQPLSLSDSQVQQLIAFISQDTLARDAFAQATHLLPEEISQSDIIDVTPESTLKSAPQSAVDREEVPHAPSALSDATSLDETCAVLPLASSLHESIVSAQRDLIDLLSSEGA